MANTETGRNALFIAAVVGAAAVTVGLMSAVAPAVRGKTRADKPVTIDMDKPSPSTPGSSPGPTAFDEPVPKESAPKTDPEPLAKAEAGSPEKVRDQPLVSRPKEQRQLPRESAPDPPSVTVAGEPTPEPAAAVAAVPLKFSLIVQKSGGLVSDGAQESLSKDLSLSATVHAQGPVPAGARIRIEWSTAAHGVVAPFEFGPDGIGKVWEYNNKLWADHYRVRLEVDGQEWGAIGFTVR